MSSQVNEGIPSLVRNLEPGEYSEETKSEWMYLVEFGSIIPELQRQMSGFTPVLLGAFSKAVQHVNLYFEVAS